MGMSTIYGMRLPLPQWHLLPLLPSQSLCASVYLPQSLPVFLQTFFGHAFGTRRSFGPLFDDLRSRADPICILSVVLFLGMRPAGVFANRDGDYLDPYHS